jgi:hypothetical protein
VLKTETLLQLNNIRASNGGEIVIYGRLGYEDMCTRGYQLFCSKDGGSMFL